jgi:orotidine-5'-phosphate decarboxylase
MPATGRDIMIIDRLYAAVEDRGPVCVGLDTSTRLLPRTLAEKLPTSEAILSFNRGIIDATLDIAACYKVQIAHYEALGVEGLACYSSTIEYARDRGALVIGDIKRGDIAATGEMYARAHLAGDFEADFVTVNPYMGADVIGPYLPYLQDRNKGIFVLVRTSNPSASDFQDLTCPEEPLFIHVARRLDQWGKAHIGQSGYSLIGGVVGATTPEELAMVRKFCPTLFLLVPGYGAQGGSGRDVAPAFIDGNGAVVNAARSIIGAHRDKPDGDTRFAEYAREATLAMREDIRQWIKG